MKRKPRVLFAAFEAEPFFKTGGLGDVGGCLPPALKKAGCEIRLIMPKFSAIDKKYTSRMTHVADFYLDLGWRKQYCGIEKLTKNGVVCYFVDNEYYFKRDSAYGYDDDGERIAFFAKAVVDCLQYLPDFKCDILHCNDWHTALAPVFLHELYRDVPGYENIKTIFTIHNLKFQGVYSSFVLGDVLGLHKIKAAQQQLTCGDTVNYMKGALNYSDVLTTVSPTYSEEIRSAYFGEGMEDIFNRRSNVLHGILNGINNSSHDPSDPKLVEFPFTIDTLEEKSKNKLSLQRQLGLEENADVPLIVMISRLTEQKGLDLITCVFDDLMQRPIQFAVLGIGDKKYEDTFKYYQYKYPDKVSANLTFSPALSEKYYAAGDMLLMPSRFEPCGLSQMIAMRYGNIPIVRETGGLKDSVIPYNKITGEGTGFSFSNFNAHEMLSIIDNAVNLYHNDPDAWKKIVKSAMSSNFDWAASAEKYMQLYMSLYNK